MEQGPLRVGDEGMVERRGGSCEMKGSRRGHGAQSVRARTHLTRRTCAGSDVLGAVRLRRDGEEVN